MSVDLEDVDEQTAKKIFKAGYLENEIEVNRDKEITHAVANTAFERFWRNNT